MSCNLTAGSRRLFQTRGGGAELGAPELPALHKVPPHRRTRVRNPQNKLPGAPRSTSYRAPPEPGGAAAHSPAWAGAGEVHPGAGVRARQGTRAQESAITSNGRARPALPEKAWLGRTAGSKERAQHGPPAGRARAGEQTALGGGQQAHAGLRRSSLEVCGAGSPECSGAF